MYQETEGNKYFKQIIFKTNSYSTKNIFNHIPKGHFQNYHYHHQFSTIMANFKEMLLNIETD